MNAIIYRISIITALFVTPFLSQAQYTETINTNNPGLSQGAYALGTGVAQVEANVFYRTEEHVIQRYERDYYGLNFQLRYGAFFEELEFSYIGRFASVEQTQITGFGNSQFSFNNFSRSTLGAKYMFFDPKRVFGEKKINLYSYHANNRLNWKDLIPALAIYAGANIDLSDNNLLTPPNDPTFSPRIELITQNNWGRWVLVTNFGVDRLGTDFPSWQWIITMTHSINNKWAFFGEYQGFKSDFYSDDLARGGATYLINKDWQVDSSVTVNFKDTPTVFQVNLGMSYRIDFHKDPEIKQSSSQGGNKRKKKNKENKLNLEEDQNPDGRG
ncbi:hypothetical protein JCM19294_1060 [Nonlabens tegetincola]|uniref:Phenol meta deg superfamily protein n=1 Tax=Nonlabens tegetincola TaxID=323273 RepID=A0A090QMI1_9FLAO|nr:transporter [Nonlabens tegetincola]GAK96751.1 hypothetical protein JCM19294_1060 [Nonlabens tegetincola]